MPTLTGLLQRLIAHKVAFVLVGGYAATVHGSTLVTRDVDVCCGFDEENLRRIHAALADLHPVHRMRPDLPFVLTSDLPSTLKNLYLKTDWGSLDFLGEVKGVGNYAAVLTHSVWVELPIGECRVIDLNTLIQAKQAMGREHDLITVRQLQAIRDARV